MVLEATVICVDNSEHMRNGDVAPTRWQVRLVLLFFGPRWTQHACCDPAPRSQRMLRPTTACRVAVACHFERLATVTVPKTLPVLLPASYRAPTRPKPMP